MAERKELTLLIAGPGAGKTYGMVQEIVTAAPQLEAHRFLAAITFTNTATDEISKGVSQRIQIPPNLFIGTIHSFLIKFLIKPYASVLNLARSEKTYLDIEVARYVEEQAGSQASPAIKAAIKSRTLEALYDKGIIPLSFISSLAAKIITNKKVRAALGSRLQYLFIDEFQDVDLSQYKIFNQIRIAKRTSIRAVGDPEQYITSHTYRDTSISSPRWDCIPFQRLAEKAIVSRKEINRRSCEQIVRFTNNFHSELDQESERGSTKHGKVVFIDSSDLEQILTCFREISSVLTTDDQPLVRFYLGRENALYRPYHQAFELKPISKRNTRTARPLEAAEKLLCSVSGMGPQRIRQLCELDRLAYRGIALKLLRAITKADITTEDEVRKFVQAHLPKIKQDTTATIQRSLQQTEELLAPSDTSSNEEHRYATIHKAKGLEAPAVLAVAKTLNELKHWLTTDKTKRAADKSDTCRLGYVAFTRAEDILCIGCKHPLDLEARSTLAHLNVEFITPASAASDGQLGLDFG